MVGDTIVVCRPEQVREAAIVLACGPADRFTPLVVLERPPISETEYRARYEAYVEARDRRDALTGTALARETAAARPDEVAALTAEVDRKAVALTAYRSWWQHQRLVADLLAALPLRRAVFLFVPEAEEIDLIHPIPIRRIADTRVPTIPPGIERTYVLEGSRDAPAATPSRVYDSLAALPDVAWELFGRPGRVPADVVTVPADDVRAYFSGLHHALQLGVPLRPGPAATPRPAPNAPDRAGDEAVLIEVTADATRLLGVQYAHERRARLVLVDPPDLDAVERARLQVEQREDDAKAAGPKLFEALRRYFLEDPVVADGIARMEAAVSAAVPDEAVAAVGDRPLTVFTSGVPYTFVRKAGADWAEKPIGHVAGDASLLVLTELCRPASVGDAGFSLIFDPGFFETTETRDVLAVLGTRASYPLVLRGDASSSMALLVMTPAMPLDVLFFNTHGSDKGIVLKDGELPAFKLQQRVRLASRPFVFNNSCVSWAGVGREFVRIGARGYVGTLWSVDAEMAARYARTVLDRMTRDGWPVSRAMRGTGVDRATERAYIFVGTCGSRLSGMPATDGDAPRRRAVTVIRALLGSAVSYLRFTGSRADIPFAIALEKVLWTEAERLLKDYDARWPAPHVDRLHIAIDHLSMLSYAPAHRREDVRRRLDRFEAAERMLRALNLPAKDELARHSELLHIAGRIHLQLGQVARAVELLSQSIREGTQAGIVIGPAALELSDAFKVAGRPQDALGAAQQADAVYAAAGAAAPPEGRLLAIGRLAQLESALGRYHRALEHARHGFQLATTLDIATERAEFKGDEARTLLRLRQYPEALVAAKEYLDLARLAYDDAREVAAYGVIGQALLGSGDLAGAREYATKGLAEARARRFDASVGDFLIDLAVIEAEQDAHAGALRFALEAAASFAATVQVPKARNALGLATDQYNALVGESPATSTWGALAGMLEVEVAMIDVADEDFRHAIVVEVVGQVGKLMLRVGPGALRAELDRLAEQTEAGARRYPGTPPKERAFIARAFRMYAALAAGRVAEAREAAAALDRAWGGGPQLQQLVDTIGRRSG
jgi:tetratricopeptide (TPR) repeat protein